MSKDNSRSLDNDSPLQELQLNSNKNNLTSTTSDCYYVRSHFRNRSKSVASSSSKSTIAQHLMDPATFRLILDTQKQNLADAKERGKQNKSTMLHKNEWKHFFSTKKKKRRVKALFVWQVKKNKQHKAEMEFIKSIHDLKIPMDTDQYKVSVTKKALVSDSYVDSRPETTLETSMDVDSDSDSEPNHDSDSDSEPEGDDSMTIALLMNQTNSSIDSLKPKYDEQQTQLESPTQLFQDSDESSDDEGEFLFEE